MNATHVAELIYAITASLIGFFSFRFVRKKKRDGSEVRWWIRYVLALFICAAPILCARLGIFAVWGVFNIGAVLASFLSYCYFSFASFAVRPRAIGIIAGSLLVAPIVMFTLVLPFSILGVMFVLQDIGGPYEVTSMPNGFVCQSKISGSAVGESDQTVELLRPVFGFLMLRVARTSFSL